MRNPINPTIVQTFNDIMSSIKNGVLAMVSVFGISITGVGVYQGVRSDEISLDEIKVPGQFEEQGYRTDITTIRILDEVKKLQNSNGSAKEKVSFFGASGNNQLQTSNLQLGATGFDVKAIQSFIRDSLGMVTVKVSGEITARKDGDDTEYHVKIRKTPENSILVDEKIRGNVEYVIRKTSLKLLESTDPHIAAASYWSMNDEVNALRMIDVVLGNDIISDDKFSLNLRAYINITNKRLDDAQADIDQLSKIAPDFIPLLSSKSWIARERGNFEESLKLSDEQIKRAPEKWWGHQARAQSLQGLKRNDEAQQEYLKVVEMRPSVPGPYLNASAFFVAKSDLAQAAQVLRIGVSKFNQHPMLSLTYADVLQHQKMFAYSESLYRPYLSHPKFKIYALVGIGELLFSQQKEAELKAHKDTLRQYIKDHPLSPGDTKMLGERLDALFM